MSSGVAAYAGSWPGSGAPMTPPVPSAVVLDVDGTLVDSNWLHVVAWWEAFVDQGHEVSCRDVHRAIGLPSDDLVRALLGRADERVVQGHAERWPPLRRRMLACAGAGDLVRGCAERGLRVVWATSGSEDDVADSRAAVGADEAVHAVVSSSDVEHGKPAPDVVLAALEAAGVTAERAVLVGDTVYDVRAATAARVPCIALLAGGTSRADLAAEGPAAVYAGCAELLADLDASPVGRLLR